MKAERPINDPEKLLRIADYPSRDGLRIALQPHLTDEVLRVTTAFGFEGGPFSEKVCRGIRDTGVMPPSEVMSGSTEEAGPSWPREVFELARWGHEYPAWQCFCTWVLLTWVADPADDDVTVADDATICSLVSSAARLTPDICAHGVAFLRWQAPARNEPGPTVYHELASACLFAAMFREMPGLRLRDALETQCQHVLDTADRELLTAIEGGHVYNLNWPLDIDQSLAKNRWRELCEELLSPPAMRVMPGAAAEILTKLRHGH